MAALYPISPDREAEAIVQCVWLGEREPDGTALLRTRLTVPQERHLRERSALLRKALEPASHGKIKSAVSQMMIGFNRAADEKSAAATVAQFITVLQTLPAWAVERACQRFAAGLVREEEVEGLNRAFPPTTAQVFTVAQALVAGYRAEAERIFAVLRGRVGYQVSDADRKRVSEGLQRLAAEMRGNAERRLLAEQEERAKRDAGRPRREREPMPMGAAIAAAMGKTMPAPEPGMPAREPAEELEP